VVLRFGETPDIVKGPLPKAHMIDRPEKLNATQVGQLLGISPKTLRKRLNPRYAGPGRIRGATRDGRDWLIPVQEVDRLLAGKRAVVAVTKDRAGAFAVLFETWKELTNAARSRLAIAARNYGDGSRDGALAELRGAIEQWDDLAPVTKLLLGLRREAKGRVYSDTLAQMVGQKPGLAYKAFAMQESTLDELDSETGFAGKRAAGGRRLSDKRARRRR
jgi:hypothetical protein